MSESAFNAGHLLYLAEIVCDENASIDDVAELDAILLADATSRRIYWDYCRMHVALEMEMQANHMLQRACEQENLDSSALAPWESDVLAAATLPTASASSPAPTFFSTAFHSTVGFFSQEIPFSLLIATIITCLGLLIGSFVYVTHHKQIADSPAQPTPLIGKSDMEFIGRVTGMVDVKWSDINTSTEHGNGIPLGRRFALASGLMEITYDTGAKVILQGPCTYQAD